MKTIKSKIPIRKKYVPKGIKVLYEDRDIIVIEKDAGLLTVKTPYEENKTAYRLVTNYVRKGSTKSRLKLFVVHRLDRETSGVLIFAKSYEMRERFADRWKEVEKKYLALVTGSMTKKTDTIESYLTEDEKYLVRSTKNHRKGKFAKTKYTVIDESKKYSLLEIDLLTGRKNQIRVHLAEAGHPIVGDIKYGTDSKQRLCLHAWSIKFKHPYTDEEMEFETPIPGCFQSYF